MYNLIKKIKYPFCLLLGLLAGMGFPPHSWILMQFLTYSLFFYFLDHSKTKKSCFMIGFSFGFSMGACSMFWLVNALLIDAESFAWLTPLVPIGFGILFGLFFAIPSLLSYYAKNSFARLFLFAATFSFFEWVRCWFLTGFPWNLLGSIWVSYLPILQSVSFLGVLGLSLISIFWLTVPYFIYLKKYFFAFLTLISFITVLGLGQLRLSSAENNNVWGVQLRLVQPNIPQTLKWNPERAERNFMKHIRLSKTKPNNKVTHVLWAETASPYLLDIDENARSLTMSALPQGAHLITGSMRMVNPKTQSLANSIFIINDMAEIKSFYDKSHLVPFGEYLPLRGILPFEKIVPFSSDIHTGKQVKTLPIAGAPPMGALICYEVIFPHNVVDEDHRPSWIFNATNDGWYGISAGPYQHLAAAQIRAAEEGLPIVRVAGSGISAVISPMGEILSSIPLGKEGILDSPLPKKINPTFYARLGNIIPLFLSFCCLIVFLSLNRKK